MSIVLYTVYTIAHLALVAWGLTVWRRTRRVGTLLIILVTLGVGYDNLILALGNTFGAGALLYGLSIPRFALHQLILPWLIVAAYQQAKVAGHKWASHRASAWLALAGTLVILAPRLRVYIFPIPVPVQLWIAVIGGFLLISFFPNVAWQAHLGGLLFGMAAAYYIKRRGGRRVYF